MLLLWASPKSKGIKYLRGHRKAQASTFMSMKLLLGRDGIGGGKWKGSIPRLILPELLGSGAEFQRIKSSKSRHALPGC